METILFDGLSPHKFIWVSPTGSYLATGSESSPLKTIQAAVNKATAGTAIMVAAGVYNENVKLPTNALGTPDNPIWLISADGPQAAKIVGLDQTLGTIYGYGTDNYVISGFEIEGGFRGIQFSQSGRDFTNMVSNVLVIGNVIHDTKEDGIKIGQADNATVVGNTIFNVVEEGIDFLAVNNGVIAYNDVSNAKSTAAAIFAKGGSTGILIENNHVHDIPNGDGICIGGQTAPEYFRPGYMAYEAKNVIVVGNYVEDVARRPVNVKGALDSKIIDNYLVGNPSYYAAVAIQMGWDEATSLMYSKNIEIAGNILVGNQKVVVHDGNDNDISIHDNASSGQWTTLIGPDAYLADTVNDAPTDIKLSSSVITENARGVTVGVLSAVDPDHDTHTFLLKDDPSGLLEIVGNTLRLKTGASLDFEATPSLQVEIEVQDAAGAAYSKTVTLSVRDVLGVNLSGNARVNTLLGTPEADTLNGKGGNDILDGAGGIDTAVYSGKSIDYSIVKNGDGSWSIVDLRTRSPDGSDKLWNIELLQFGDGLKTLNVQAPPPTTPEPTNAAPVIVSANATGSVIEWIDKSAAETADTPHTTSGAVIYSDADALDLHTALFSAKGAGYLGAFSLDTVAIDSADTVGWFFTVSDSAMESLKAGATKVQLYDVTISDGHGGAIIQTITITLTGADDAAAAAGRTRKARGGAQESNNPANAPDGGSYYERHDARGDDGGPSHHAASDLVSLVGAHLSLHNYDHSDL
jgi:VCBS repeat-containing protein